MWIKNYVGWDDDIKVFKRFQGTKYKIKNFLRSLNYVDYIIVSPGININKVKLKNFIKK